MGVATDLKPRATMSDSIKAELKQALRGGVRLSGEQRKEFLARQQQNLNELILQMKR